MLAFVLEKPGDNFGVVKEIPKPALDPGFALIHVRRAGICNTDIEILKGYMGFSGVLGHEFVGVVEEVHDEADRHWIGKRVCGDINVGCAKCSVCTNLTLLDDRGCPKMSRNHCPNRTVLGILNRNGTMAEYLTLPIRNLHEVPPSITDEEAVFSEPLAAACRIPEQGLVRYGPEHPDRVAILGDGKLGLMIAEVLGRAHAKMNSSDAPAPILFGKHQHKLDLVSNSGVSIKLVSVAMDGPDGIVPEFTGAFDVVVEATGSPAGLTLASKMLRPMGTLVLKSTCAAGETFHAAPFVVDELRVVGSRCGPIDEALDLLKVKEANGATPMNVTKYITRAFPLADAEEAMECAKEKSTMKVQLICSQ